MKKLLLFLLLIPILGTSQDSIEVPSEKKAEKTEREDLKRLQQQVEFNVWKDTKHTFKLLGVGAYKQFTQKNNLYYMGAAVPSLYWVFEEDERVKNLMLSKDMKKSVEAFGALGVIFNFPLIPAAAWYYGKKTKSNHWRQFAMEYAATLYLALGESGLLSFIQVHERPVNSNNSFWEEAFRGDSSWPSGHVIPYMALTFKTYQFFGPYWATIPLGLSYVASLQRMQDGKHWLSDVVASFFLSAFASEGVRAANGYHQNHPVYKWMFEHDFQVGMIRNGSAWGPRIGFTF